MKIGIELDHAAAAGILTDAGVAVPRIPPGKNTVLLHFSTAAGQPALAINQTGFSRVLADNEEQINGLSVAIVLDDTPAPAARAALDDWAESLLSPDN